MKVAIIGAGISGLSCARELVRNGIEPVIFEKKGYIGGQLNYSGIWPRQFTFPAEDTLHYLKKKHEFEIKPMEKLTQMEVFSPEKKIKITGELGYVFKGGKETFSLENQLAEKLNIPILFDSLAKIDELVESFDKIIVATGNHTIAKQLDVWTDTFAAWARIATVLGDFDTNGVKVWLYTRYAKNVFCYLIPNNPREASLVMIVNGISHDELYDYWDKFISQENIPYDLTEISDRESRCGFASSLEKEHIYFAGNAGGFTYDFIGAGAFTAVLSGIYAAKAILENKSYDVLCKPLYKEIIRLHKLRKAMNTLDNGEFDALVSLLGTHIVKQYVCKNPFLKLRYREI